MTSNVETHGHVKRCRGVHAIDYALLDGKSGSEVLQKHPHPTINSRGGWEGWVSLGVSIEAGNKLECSSPRDVSYAPGCDVPCVDAQTKSYSDTNGEQWAPTATETQGDPFKGEGDEETNKVFKLECDKKELVNCSEDQKRMIARDKFKANTGIYEGFLHVTEVLQLTPYQETDNSVVETRRLQGQECNTGPEAQATTGTQGLLVQAHRNCTSSQDARIQDAPEAMAKMYPPEQSLVQMILSKEATELSQDLGYSNAPEAMGARDHSA
jgi:hypothetical protein